MASSPDPFIDPDPPFEGTSSPPLPPTTLPPNHLIDTEMEVELSSSLPPLPNIPTGPATRPRAIHTFDFSSDPLGEGHLSFRDCAASGRRPASFVRKRGPPARDQGQEPRTKEPRNQDPRTQDLLPQDQEPPSSLAKAKILEARDLLLQACTLTKSHDEQSRLLDLLEVFREYTEKGRLYKSSNIIASQVANLESAARKIESKAKALASTPSQDPSSKNPSFATIASIDASKTTSPKAQEWTLVSSKPKTKAKEQNSKAKAKDRRVILIQDPECLTSTPFSPLRLRNAINTAFQNKGVKEPVVATVSKTLTKNIVVTTTSSFSANYLLEKQALWAHLIPHQAIQKDTPWFKVAVNGVPFTDFDTPDGMALVKEEISTFNKGLKPIGTPYWLTPQSRRQDPNQRAGTVAVAFATEEEANRAIQNRLYIAGISARVEKLYSLPPSTQCPKCQSFGHLENKCRQTLACALCSEKHPTRNHSCSQCKAIGTSCKHLVPKCSNCQGPHLATSLSCEVRKALFKTITL
jgi:hypothetical protein